MTNDQCITLQLADDAQFIRQAKGLGCDIAGSSARGSFLTGLQLDNIGSWEGPGE